MMGSQLCLLLDCDVIFLFLFKKKETQTSIHLLARAKTRAILEPLRTRARQSWMHRWGSLLACAAAWAFGSSLLERRGQPGSDGEAPPAVDVLGDFTKAQGASPWV